MDSNTFVVIMAGGVGSRFWPYSRNSRPKQFIDVLGTGKSLLRMTCDRFLKKVDKNRIFIVTSQQYTELVKEQLPELEENQILGEPSRKNTAPCIAYAAYKIRERHSEAVMIVSPSDQMIFDDDQFIKSIDAAVNGAKNSEKIVTIGIQPHRPDTGYGYIQYAQEDNPVKKVKRFTEKPDRETAEQFLNSGDFVWNAGIFVWDNNTLISSFEKHEPEIAQLFESGKGMYYSALEEEFIEKTYQQCKSISVDYAIMEKSSEVHVVLGNFGWSDLGSWNSLHENLDKDEDDNVVNSRTLIYNSRDNFIKTKEGKIVILQDLQGYLVGDFDDVLIICKKDQESQFRTYVKDVKENFGEDFV